MVRKALWPAAAAVVAALAWIAGWQLPWLEVEGAAQALGRHELLASKVDYERMLVAWPLIALPVASAALAVLAWAEQSERSRPWLVAAGAVGAFCGAVALVTGGRLIGFAAVRAMDPGGALVRPGLAALAVAAAGACVLAASLWMLRRHAAPIPPSAVVAGATLVLMPFIPFGETASGGLLYDELSLASAAASGGVLQSASQALGWMRAALWVGVLAGALVVALAPLTIPRMATWRFAALAVGPLAAAGLCGLFLARWAHIDGLGWSWNAAAPLGTLAALALLAGPARSAMRPDSATQGVFKDNPQ